MKNLYLTFVLLTISALSYATIHHVDNSQNRPNGYYSNLQTCINNANAGDSIYIYPSNQDYGSITLTKKLHLFGFGFNGTTNGVSKVAYIYLDSTTIPSSTSSGSSIQGLTIQLLTHNKFNINNIKILGNYIYSSGISISSNSYGWQITNNIVNYIQVNHASSVVISNNIFNNESHGIYYSSSATVLINHNIFCSFQFFNQVNNANVMNNIFLCNSVTNSGYMYNNVFSNNLSYYSNSTYNLPPTGNTGTGNLSNVNPQFENALLTGDYKYLSGDYHLKTTSTALTAGSDGTAIGHYGGSTPFIENGGLTIPKVTEVLITNPVVDQGTSINVKIKAKKADL
jgi:hypothetical protein